MKTTVKSTTNEKSTQQNAPPAWTLPYLEATASRVGAAVDQLPGTKYTGDFFARPDMGLVDQLGSIYNSVGQNSARAGNTAFNVGNQFLTGLIPGNTVNADGSVRLGLATPMGPKFGMELPQFAAPAGFKAPNILDAPDFNSLVPQFGPAPDLSQFTPQMAAAPTWQGFTPEAWMADDGGQRLTAAIKAANQPVLRDLMNNVLPSLRSSALESGAWTGDRAMKVETNRAIADSAGRMAEITDQLVYQGFQQEEARRLAAWQTAQEIGNQQSLGQNQFNLGVFGEQNNFELAAKTLGLDGALRLYGLETGNQLDVFKTLVNANTSTYGTQQDALLRAAGMENDYNFANRQLDINSALDLFGLDTDRALGVADSRRQDAALGANIQQQGLQQQAAQADLLQQLLALRMGVGQNEIDNALARDNYDTMYPFRGLDIASALLAQLSGNYGTINREGTSTSTQSTSGAGPIMQGVLGAGLAAGSVFGGGGPLASLLKPAASAGGGISTIFSPGGIWGKAA